MSSLLRYFKRRLNTLARVGSDPHRDFCRLGGKLLLIIPNCKRTWAQQKAYLFCLTGSERNALKLTQCANRLCCASSLEPEIALHRFYSWARPSIGDVRARAQSGALSRLASLQVFIQTGRADFCFIYVKISIAEIRVRQPEAKRELWAVLFVDVARNIFFIATAGRARQVNLPYGPPGIQRIVIERLLADAARPTYGKPSAGIYIAKQGAHKRGPCLNARKPSGHHCGHMLERPRQSEWAATED